MVSSGHRLSATDGKLWNTARSDDNHRAISTPSSHSEELLKEHGFTVSVVLLELLCLLFFALKFRVPKPEDSETARDSTMKYYPMFMDVHVMIFVGIGFLMTFLRKYSLSALSLNFIVGVLSLQWGIIVVTMVHQIGDNDFETIVLDVPTLIRGDCAAAAVLISFGAVLGKTTPTQLVWMTFLEVMVYGVNEYVVIEELVVTDAGGSVVLHTFGAFFGLAVAYVLGVPTASEQAHKTSRYHSDVFAMLGTLVLWVYWPSFNAALVASDAFQQERAVLNTVLSLAASCAAAFVTSKMVSPSGHLDLVHVQNATLAGGVAIGTSCNLAISPVAAISVGLTAGVVATVGYVYVTPHVEREYRVADTCGILSLHGMPGLVGGVVGATVTFSTADDYYGDALTSIYPARSYRSAAKQGWYQLLALVVSFALSTLAGLVVGYVLKSKWFRQQKLKFEDDEWFHVAEENHILLSLI